MHFRPLPPAEYLRERLNYDPESGELRWKAKHGTDRETNRWNSKHCNKTAGCLEDSGYVRVSLDGINYVAHRLIWRMVSGEESRIDHKNNNRSDNRWTNLRVATVAQNAQNRGVLSTNKSGFVGVYWRKDCQKWTAAIKTFGKKIVLGLFESSNEAAIAYRQAATQLRGEYAHKSTRIE